MASLLDDPRFDEKINSLLSRMLLDDKPAQTANPAAAGMLAAGLGMLANNRGNAWESIGRGGLMGLQAMQDERQRMQKDPMQQIQMANAVMGLQTGLQNQRAMRDFQAGAPNMTQAWLQEQMRSPNKEVADRAQATWDRLYKPQTVSQGQTLMRPDGSPVASVLDPTKPIPQGDGSYGVAPGALEALAALTGAQEGAKVPAALATEEGKGNIGLRNSRGRTAQHPIIDATKRLDIRRLRKAGVLTPGAMSVWKWTSGGEAAGSVVIAGRQGGIRVHHGPMNRDETDVELRYRPCRYGGRRAYFSCPHCWRWCEVIVMTTSERSWGCRKCLRLRYLSQRQTQEARMDRRADRLQDRAGVYDEAEDFVYKHKRMRWVTFNRLMDQADELHGQSSDLFMSRICRKFGPAIMKAIGK